MIEEAIADVVTAVTGLDRGDGEDLTVTDFMPMPGAQTKPAHLVVAFSGLSDTDIGVTVTLAVDASTDPEAAEKVCRALCPTIDRALDATPAPRSEWSKTYADSYGAYMVETTLVYPRDDF